MDSLTPHSEARQRPDLDLFRFLHRAAGAGIALLARNSQGNLSPIGAATVEELDHHGELIEAHLNDELFFSINSLGVGNKTKNGLNFALTKDTDTRHLNAVWVDLDIGRPEAAGTASISVSEAKQGIVDAMQAGIIPQPSATIESGRGIWVLWRLHHRDDHSQPPRAHDDSTVRLHRAICKELAARLKHIGADTAAINAARVCRVPSSMNAKSGKRVTWNQLHDGDGQSASYSLDELTNFLGCHETNKPRKTGQVRIYGRSIKSRGSAPARRRGSEARAKYRAQDIEKISEARGGYREGQRWHTLTIYAHQLKLSGATFEQITAKVETLAAACKPAFPSSASDGSTAQIVSDSISSTRNYSEAEIVKQLKVTPTEAKRLELRSILPTSVREEREAKTKAENRTGQRETRLRALEAIIEATPDASASECQRQLSKQGIEASAATVKRDLLKLFPDRTSQAAGRPKGADELKPPSISKRFEPINLSADKPVGVNNITTIATSHFYQLRQGEAPPPLAVVGSPRRYNRAVVRKLANMADMTDAAYVRATVTPRSRSEGSHSPTPAFTRG